LTGYWGGKGSERSSSSNISSVTCITQANFITVTLSFAPAGETPDPEPEPKVVEAASGLPPKGCGHEIYSSSSSSRILECSLWGQLISAALDISGIRRTLLFSSSGSSIPADNWDEAALAMAGFQSQLVQQQQQQQAAQVRILSCCHARFWLLLALLHGASGISVAATDSDVQVQDKAMYDALEWEWQRLAGGVLLRMQ